jgi:hypothetical protein
MALSTPLIVYQDMAAGSVFSAGRYSMTFAFSPQALTQALSRRWLGRPRWLSRRLSVLHVAGYRVPSLVDAMMRYPRRLGEPRRAVLVRQRTNRPQAVPAELQYKARRPRFKIR